MKRQNHIINENSITKFRGKNRFKWKSNRRNWRKAGKHILKIRYKKKRRKVREKVLEIEDKEYVTYTTGIP